MCSYLYKPEDECSQTMNQALKETLEKGAVSYDQSLHYGKVELVLLK